MNKRRRFKLASLAVALAVGALAAISLVGQFASPAGAQAPPPPEGGMAIDCDAAASGVQSDCNVPTDATFTIQVHVTGTPAAGYVAFQAKTRWTDANLQYVPNDDPALEALWPECDIPARVAEEPGFEPNNPVGTSGLLFGCAPFPELTVGKTATGAVLEFDFMCTLDGTTTMELVPRGTPPNQDTQLGTHFLDPLGVAIDPATLSPANINCGQDPPTATPTGGVTPSTRTPTPIGGVVATALPGTGAGQQDGENGSLWLLLGTLAVAAGGLSLFGWRYAHSRR